MIIISADEADQQLPRLLRSAVEGEEITITEQGVAIARIVPAIERAVEADVKERRARRREELLARFAEGFEGGTYADWTRDELYERE